MAVRRSSSASPIPSCGGRTASAGSPCTICACSCAPAGRGRGGAVLDTAARRIGLRTLRLDRHPDQWGESFQFVVNGVPFFAKGANWIPADAFVTRITRARLPAPAWATPPPPT